jgi:GNAT superfamily N-acetyltransferase
MEIDWYTGPRTELRPLFELADDSQIQLDRYIDLGRILVARRGARTLGHLQLISGTRAGDIELKSMAVVPEAQGSGVGRALVDAAVRWCASEGWSTLFVSTAAADVGNLRFYQRVGFRMRSVERDAFTQPPGIRIPS